MLRAQSDSVAVPGTQVGRRLVGNWTLDVKPPVTKHIVPAALRTEPVELSVINSAGDQRLLCLWTLQSQFMAETSCARDVCDRPT